MGYEALRELARSLMFGTFETPAPLAIPAVVTPPESDPVETAIIPLSDSLASPGGARLQQEEQRRIFAIRRDHVPAVPRGTLIACTAPLENGEDAPTLWEVDENVGTTPDHQRVAVRPAALES